MDSYNKYLTITGPYRFFGSSWVKLFAKSPDGIVYRIQEMRIDDEIANTWRNTPSQYMNGVELHIDQWTYRLQSPDKSVHKFWQSDDYESVPGGSTKMIRRRVQMEVEDGWLTLEVDLRTQAHRLYISEKKI